MAVYTRLSSNQQDKIKALYQLSSDSEFIEIKEGVLNTNYLVKDTNTKYILRILEGDRELDEELKELTFLNALQQKGVVCPQAISTQDGNRHFLLDGKICSLFTFLAGEKVTVINQAILKDIGYNLGMLHDLKTEYTLNRIKKIDIDYFYEKFKQVDLEQVLGSNHYKLIHSNYRSLDGVDFTQLPTGIIHNDIFPDNVFVGNKMAIIDFNDCMTAPYLIDLAIVINFWIKLNNFSEEEQTRLTTHFLDSYEKIRPLTSLERQLLPQMLKRVALTFIFLRIYKFHIENNDNINIESKDYQELLTLLDDK